MGQLCRMFHKSQKVQVNFVVFHSFDAFQDTKRPKSLPVRRLPLILLTQKVSGDSPPR